MKMIFILKLIVIALASTQMVSLLSDPKDDTKRIAKLERKGNHYVN
ncbi:hypothetical protein [Pediococcus pentosaceus]|nr:hypothetical protein [Pediococcus pentosaceus]